MTAAEIQSAFPVPVWFADSTYDRPTLRWLQGPFWEIFRQDRWAKVGRYSRTNDCDNFARAYAQLAQDCHAISHGSEAEALAVGEVFYTSARGPHAICCAFTEQGLKWIEPQDGSILNLTPAEIATCTFVRF